MGRHGQPRSFLHSAAVKSGRHRRAPSVQRRTARCRTRGRRLRGKFRGGIHNKRESKFIPPESAAPEPVPSAPTTIATAISNRDSSGSVWAAFESPFPGRAENPCHRPAVVNRLESSNVGFLLRPRTEGGGRDPFPLCRQPGNCLDGRHGWSPPCRPGMRLKPVAAPSILP